MALFLLTSDTTLTPPTRGGSTIVGTSSVSMILLISVATIACRSTASTTTVGPICVRVEHLDVGVHARRHTRVVLLYKKHHLQVEERQRRLLPRADSRLNRPVFLS